MEKVTPSQIKKWKEDYGDVFMISVEDVAGYVRKPDRKVLDHALTASDGGKRAMKFNETILRDIWLGGDKKLLDDDEYFFAVSEQLDELVKSKKAELKKL